MITFETFRVKKPILFGHTYKLSKPIVCPMCLRYETNFAAVLIKMVNPNVKTYEMCEQ